VKISLEILPRIRRIPKNAAESRSLFINCLTPNTNNARPKRLKMKLKKKTFSRVFSSLKCKPDVKILFKYVTRFMLDEGFGMKLALNLIISATNIKILYENDCKMLPVSIIISNEWLDITVFDDFTVRKFIIGTFF
jgi:hypothetical protein